MTQLRETWIDGDGYDEVTIVVDGALDETRIYSFGGSVSRDQLQEQSGDFDALLAELETAAEHDELEIEVYVLTHGHPIDTDDCACAQYATDHHPNYIFGRKS